MRQKDKVVRSLMCFLIIVGATVGCQRKVVGGPRTSITIRVPESANAMNKTGSVGAMSSMPSDRKACYGVIVTGTGITGTPAKGCAPATGLIAGFAEPGGELTIEVAKGPGRKFELYAFLQNVGQNLPCPAMSATMSPAQLVNTYLIGVANNVDTSAVEVNLEITASFPGVNNNLAQQMSMPASCTAGAYPTRKARGFHISTAARSAWQVGYTPTTSPILLIGRVGRTLPMQTMTGTGVKLIAK